MRFPQVTIIASCLLLCVGCDVLNHSQFVVSPIHQNDERKASAIVRRIALENGLQDKTARSTVPGVLGSYLQPEPHFPISLGARRAPDAVVVDLLHFHPGASSTPPYDKIESQLESSLRESFDARLKVPDHDDFVPIPEPRAKAEPGGSTDP